MWRLSTGRAYFNTHSRPAYLQIEPVEAKDAGDYRCRVDFKKGRTVNTVIALKVIGIYRFRIQTIIAADYTFYSHYYNPIGIRVPFSGPRTLMPTLSLVWNSSSTGPENL